ncbi:helix-turn-helix domain-containing protein [Nitrosophilus kaiyonis]|uniref:helix-turn-helix domain-containing protein n=1 Tax=Nitrosophilus kaiyonis TaxID=2930200 RepID=UPI00249102B7|nr:helix-turn-helix domain-containing protein [Nitrosophilus kaiyonis]
MSYAKNRMKIELNDIYLTIEEAADYIRVHPDSIYKLINDGTFVLNKHYYRPKGLKIIRIKKSALDEFMMNAESEAEKLAEDLLKNVC